MYVIHESVGERCQLSPSCNGMEVLELLVYRGEFDLFCLCVSVVGDDWSMDSKEISTECDGLQEKY